MMKKKFLGVIVLLLLIVSACQNEEQLVEPVPQRNEEAARVAADATGPQWLSGFPTTVFGASSVDIKLKTNIDSKVYWVIATSELTLDPAVLKGQTSKTTMKTIKFKGVTTLVAGVEKIEMPVKLKQKTKYYAYMVAESKSGEILQTQVKSFSFTTYARQEIKEYHSRAENRTVQYLLYRPEDALKYPNERKYPICFFIAGDGEIGSQGTIRLIRNGSIPEYINRGYDVPMIVMSIQHIRSHWNVDMIDEGVSHAFANYAVNTRKVYMTGMSGGGYGTWNYAVSYPNRLTAIVPISGGGDNGRACSLNNVAVYAFHNSTDGKVSTNGSISMVNAVNACPPAQRAKLLLFPDAGHNCWRRVYNLFHPDWKKSPTTDKVDIYAWMLSKSK